MGYIQAAASIASVFLNLQSLDALNIMKKTFHSVPARFIHKADYILDATKGCNVENRHHMKE